MFSILFKGTPGVGKSYLCKALSEKLNFKWHDISSIAKEKGFIEEYDEEYNCPVLDEDKVNRKLKYNFSYYYYCLFCFFFKFIAFRLFRTNYV